MLGKNPLTLHLFLCVKSESHKSELWQQQAAGDMSNSCLVTKGFSFLLAWEGGGMGWGDTWADDI